MLTTLRAAAAGLATCILAAATPAVAQQEEPAALTPASLIVTNARVWTGDSTRAEATAFAVRDGEFIAVGTEEDVAPFRGEGTRAIDAQGRRVIPGIIDSHAHLANAARHLAQLDLRPAASREELLELVRTAASKLGEGDWVLGRGWSAESWPDQRPPTADELDAAAGGRPVALMRMDGHSLIASRKALEAGAVTKDGPEDPAGGCIGRDSDGAPDGRLFEGAMGLVMQHAPADNAETLRQRLKAAMREANSVGVTRVGAIETQATVEQALVPLDEAGELTLRCHVSISHDGPDYKSWRSTLRWMVRSRNPSPRVEVIGIKGFMDGSLGSRTAWMFEPFLDDPNDPENAGLPLAMAGSGELRKLVFAAAVDRFQPAIHAIGDRANAELLTLYTELPTLMRMRLQPRVEHAQHLRPGDIDRFASLKVVASMQPLHKADDGRYAEQRLGAERVRTSYAFRDLLDAGVTVAFGSDWPVVSVNPFLGMEAAVTARTLDGRTFVPEQSITIEEALRAYTVGSAKALLCASKGGMIRQGFDADFVVLDRDVLSVPSDQIGQTVPVLTSVGGEVVFERR